MTTSLYANTCTRRCHTTAEVTQARPLQAPNAIHAFIVDTIGYRSETLEVELEADPGKSYDANRTLINAGLGFTFKEFLRAA